MKSEKQKKHNAPKTADKQTLLGPLRSPNTDFLDIWRSSAVTLGAASGIRTKGHPVCIIVTPTASDRTAVSDTLWLKYFISYLMNFGKHTYEDQIILAWAVGEPHISSSSKQFFS